MAAPPDFRALYDAELPYVARTLRRLGVAPADLEDVTHDVFVIVYRRRDDRDEARPVRPWLFGIAFRVVGNYHQKAHRRHERVDGAAIDDAVDHAADDPGSGGSPQASLAQRQQRTLLLSALATLALDHRAVIVLHELDGLAAPAIADVLDVPVNTVYSRIRAARAALLAATRRLREEP